VQHLKKPIEMKNYQKYKLIILCAFSSIFMIILYNYSRNGRYIFKNDSSVILDTRNGRIYIPSNKIYVEIDDFKKGK
jgi:hypothetical protein